MVFGTLNVFLFGLNEGQEKWNLSHHNIPEIVLLTQSTLLLKSMTPSVYALLVRL